MKVMLVDDEEWCLEELSEIIENTGMAEITGAYSSAIEAFTVAIRDKPDVIFIDVQMTHLDGLELAQRIRQEAEGVHIVLMSEKNALHETVLILV